MGDLDLYRRQHRDLMAAAERLAAEVDAGRRDDPDGTRLLRTCVADLSGRLMVHLQMEDRSLYPDLLASPHADLRDAAARFHRSLGALRATTEAFSRRWLRPAAIEEDRSAFSAELRALLHALAERIAAEDAELFPLADR